MQIVESSKAPKAIGPYSHGMKHGDLVFTSGQIPADPATGDIVGDNITAQAKQSLENLAAVLEAAGSGMDAILKTTCFLADMDDFAAFNAVYAEYIPGKPARSCVAVKTLPKNVLVEIEAVAVVK